MFGKRMSRVMLLATSVALAFPMTLSAIRQRYALALVVHGVPMVLHPTEYQLHMLVIPPFEVFRIMLHVSVSCVAPRTAQRARREKMARAQG